MPLFPRLGRRERLQSVANRGPFSRFCILSPHVILVIGSLFFFFYLDTFIAFKPKTSSFTQSEN